MEVSEIRRRVRAAIESARREAKERRVRADRAALEYQDFLRDRAVPLFQTVAAALVAEGYRFKVFTPADSVRLTSETSGGNDFIELSLDATADPPTVIGRTSRGRGSRLVDSERPVNEGKSIADLSAEDLLAFLMEEISAFVER
jgi:hypothetical protein